MDKEAIFVLERIATALEKSLTTSSDGFVEPVNSRTILYANTNHGDRWYTLQNGQPVLAPTAALRGKIMAIDAVDVDRRNRTTTKLRITVETRSIGLVVIEAGIDTQFSKSFLSAFVKGGDQAKGIVTIQCVQSKQEEQILFCQLYDSENNLIWGHYDAETDWHAMLKAAVSLAANNF